MNVDLNAYKTFYLVAKYKSFTKASQALFISQPAVTQTIKKLEEQINIELFNRSPNGKIALTAAGEVVYYYAEKIFNLAAANKAVLEQARDASFEVINIGVPTHIGSFYLVRYLKKFNDKYPNIKFNIINKKSDEMIMMLKKRELDVVIDTNMNDFRDDLITTIKILDLDSCFVCCEKYINIISKKKIELNELIQKKANLLILDEPTNHIDIDTKEMLEEALSEYKGTLFFISHDRYFINKLAEKVINIENEKFQQYLGNYDYFREQKTKKLVPPKNISQGKKSRR